MSNSPPPANPVLNAYETFIRETPLVTRYVLTSQFVTWVFSFFADPSFAVANIPHFTVFKFELYRIVLSPFICPGLFSLIFAYMSFVDNGRRLEFSMGSTAFGCLLLTIGVLTNLAYLIVSFLLYGLTGNQGLLFLPSLGIWLILFGVIAIECSKAPQNSVRRLFFFNVPTLYYPLALFGLFSLFGGFQLSYLLSIGVGYAHGCVVHLF
jgi:membrane associated rhomboid family serine protease